MPAASYPKFTKYREIQELFQPCFAECKILYGFALKGNLKRLQKLCHRRLHAPTEGNYIDEPLSEMVMLTFQVQVRYSNDPTDVTLSVREVPFWILTVSYKRLNSTYYVPGLSVRFRPYIYPQNSLAMASGQEIYSSPKVGGWFPDFPQSNQDTSVFPEFKNKASVSPPAPTRLSIEI